MIDLGVRQLPTTLDIPETSSFQSTNLDHAQSFLGRVWCPLRLDVPPGVDRFQVQTEVIRLGPLTVGRLAFSGPVAVTAPRLDSYHITLPDTGRVHVQQAGYEVVACPKRAAVLHPGAGYSARYLERVSQLTVEIDRRALEQELETLLGRPITGTLDLARSMDTGNGPGRSWRSLVHLLHQECWQPEGLLYQPLVAGRLRASVLGGLLLSLPHRYRDELRDAPPAAPPALQRAVDAIHDAPERPFSVADLAAIAGISVRSLQEGFRRHLGMAPMAYLQQVRLRLVHEALRQQDPGRITVAAVAHRWGFTHLGRFAQAYRAQYGVRPSETLRLHR